LLDHEDSPWYPTARLYRQTATRNYADVLNRVRANLSEAGASGWWRSRCRTGDVLPVRRASLSSIQNFKNYLDTQQKVHRATPPLGVVVSYDHIQAVRKHDVRA
jgi:hypothetical protein